MRGVSVLIIEREALIALSTEVALAESLAARCEVARDYREAAKLADRFGDFDLAIVNHPEIADELVVLQLAAACPAIVVCSAMPEALDQSVLAGAVVILKPFSEADLLAACHEALDRDGRPT